MPPWVHTEAGYAANKRFRRFPADAPRIYVYLCARCAFARGGIRRRAHAGMVLLGGQRAVLAGVCTQLQRGDCRAGTHNRRRAKRTERGIAHQHASSLHALFPAKLRCLCQKPKERPTFDEVLTEVSFMHKAFLAGYGATLQVARAPAKPKGLAAALSCRALRLCVRRGLGCAMPWCTGPWQPLTHGRRRHGRRPAAAAAAGVRGGSSGRRRRPRQRQAPRRGGAAGAAGGGGGARAAACAPQRRPRVRGACRERRRSGGAASGQRRSRRAAVAAAWRGAGGGGASRRRDRPSCSPLGVAAVARALPGARLSPCFAPFLLQGRVPRHAHIRRSLPASTQCFLEQTRRATPWPARRCWASGAPRRRRSAAPPSPRAATRRRRRRGA